MKRSGFTLIEVLLASTILGIGVAVMLMAASRCLGVMKRAVNFQKAQWTMSMGDLEYPIDPEDEGSLEISEDSSITEGFVYSRTAEEVEDEDMSFGEEDEGVKLFALKTTVKWSDTAPGEEAVRYVLIREKKKTDGL